MMASNYPANVYVVFLGVVLCPVSVFQLSSLILDGN
jgi:hypothetical protein